MVDNVISTLELLTFLGVDEDSAELVESLRASAVEQINRATGIDWLGKKKKAAFNEAVRVKVWLSFYGVRDEKVKTEYLERYLTGLISSLQLCAHEEADDDAEG